MNRRQFLQNAVKALAAIPLVGAIVPQKTMDENEFWDSLIADKRFALRPLVSGRIIGDTGDVIFDERGITISSQDIGLHLGENYIMFNGTQQVGGWVNQSGEMRYTEQGKLMWRDSYGNITQVY